MPARAFRSLLPLLSRRLVPALTGLLASASIWAARAPRPHPPRDAAPPPLAGGLRDRRAVPPRGLRQADRAQRRVAPRRAAHRRRVPAVRDLGRRPVPA